MSATDLSRFNAVNREFRDKLIENWEGEIVACYMRIAELHIAIVDVRNGTDHVVGKPRGLPTGESEAEIERTEAIAERFKAQSAGDGELTEVDHDNHARALRSITKGRLKAVGGAIG